MKITSNSQDKSRVVAPLEPALGRISAPIQHFVRAQTASGILLLLATLLALGMANSSWAQGYAALWSTHLGLVLGDWHFELSLRHWINDGLLVIFFYLIGLEIKREVLVGELADPKRAGMLVIVAIGGMAIPAAIFWLFNHDLPSSRGWGVPVATDIAFALGILALLGDRIPGNLKTFLAGLAIVDDIGAVLIIALFYSQGISLPHLYGAAALFALLMLFNISGVRHPLPYLLAGLALWATVLQSGIHATVAGILIALSAPTLPARTTPGLLRRVRRPLHRLAHLTEPDPMADKDHHDTLIEVEREAHLAVPPLRRWEERLQTPVALLILPLFALANAGIPLQMGVLTALPGEPLALGVALGLLIGKVGGITLFCWAAVKIGIGRLPDGISLGHIAGLGLVAGIGFTMSIFIANLAFAGAPESLLLAKSGVLLGSLLSGVAGLLWLSRLSKRGQSAQAETSPTED